MKQKIQHYSDNNIPCFPGGQFFEIAYLQGKSDAYLEEVKRTGFSHVEISDNCIDLTPKLKRDLIKNASSLGLIVLGETGKKLETSDAGEMIDDINNCLDAGAWKVFVEAAELITDQGINLELVKSLNKEVDFKHMIFEIPGQWMTGMTFDTQVSYWKMLVQTIGPDVNLANIPAEDLLRLSLMRLGLGADTTLTKGAFALSKEGKLV